MPACVVSPYSRDRDASEVPTSRKIGETQETPFWLGYWIHCSRRASPHQRSTWQAGAGYNPGMRIRLLTVLWLCGMVSAQTGQKALHADRVVVLKKERTLELLSDGKVIKTYNVALGGDPVGPITRRRKAPTFWIRATHTASFTSRSIFRIPTRGIRRPAQQRGVSPGGDVFVHGLPNGYGWVGAGHRARDWTDGCIAVTNEEIEEIWSAVADGTPIEIRP